MSYCPRCARSTVGEVTWPLDFSGQVVLGGCQECWEEQCAAAWRDFHTPQPQEESMKRYQVEVLIDGHAEERALARLVERYNASSPTPLTIEEVLSSILYDVLNAETNTAPLAVGTLLDEAHAVPRALPIEELLDEADVVFDELLQAMELTREVTP